MQREMETGAEGGCCMMVYTCEIVWLSASGVLLDVKEEFCMCCSMYLRDVY